MPPPLPPSSAAARRKNRLTGIHPDERSSRLHSGTGSDVPPRPASRRYRDDDPQPYSSSNNNNNNNTDSGRYTRRLASSSTASSSSSTHTRPITTMTTDEEIERIREMRARRKRAQQQERGEDANEPNVGSGALAHRRHRRVPSSSTPTKDTEDFDSARKTRRDVSSAGKETGTDESSLGNHTASTAGTSTAGAATSDETSIRSEIEARLAARRNKRMNAHENAQSATDSPTRRSTRASHRSTRSSPDVHDLRIISRQVPPRSSSSDALRRPDVAYGEDARDRTRSTRATRTIGTDRTRASNLPPRSTSNDISERLRERREARERERKERERKYDLKGLSSASSLEGESNHSIQSDITVERASTNAEKITNTEKKASKNPVIAPVPDASDGAGDDEDDDDASRGSTLRLCVISATDLPPSVVPNVPLCPVLKMGLVELPADAYEDNERKSVSSTRTKKLFDQGIQATGSATVRSTTPKVLSKSDDGTIDFHEEYRWDDLKRPRRMGLCMELCARGVRTPLNYMESPSASSQYDAYVLKTNSSAIDKFSAEKYDSQGSSNGRTPPLNIWNRSKKQEAEMEAAEAAAAVARMLVDDSGPDSNEMDQAQSSTKISETPNSDYDVTLRSSAEHVNTGLTSDVRLGVAVIPLTKLFPQNCTDKSKSIRLEQWYQLNIEEESPDLSSAQKKPSVLLEISLSSSQSLDQNEDEDGIFDDDEEPTKSPAFRNASFSRRASIEARCQTGEHESKKEETKIEDPVLEPGVVDFVAVIGCKNIGNQKNDGGMKGWVKATPECVVMEQFPPNNEFHAKSGRKALLPEMLQWFCYPEGARLWRGTTPPSRTDLNLKRFSAASPQNLTSSTAAFDACLDCTTSFSWFVIASNSDEYGSSLVKTYGAVIRFYVPAPTGIDPTQDDFAQAIMGRKAEMPSQGAVKRLWVPIAICFTSNLPIVGIMEALLLRLCEELSTLSSAVQPTKLEEIQEAVSNIVLKYQKPIAGAVNCSVPFLAGDRFLLSLPPRTGLPPLPHGRALVSVCRLLGADGLIYLMSAVLTECKILLHSEDIAEISMVAEVVTALTYPFTWSLPYIPVLPIGMIEFVEAPLAYLLGIPSCNMNMIDPRALDDTVVVDVNKAFSPTQYSPEKSKSKSSGNKHPTLLPASVAKRISEAVYKLLRDEDAMEEQYSGSGLLEQNFPHLEDESLAEREFRVTVAIEICGFLRGYQECMGAVFDRDKFLKTSPALYEEKSEYKFVGGGSSGVRSEISKTKVVSSRSKRFLSSLVSGQNFQQLLESLDSDEASFFHEIMDLIDDSTSDRKPPKRTPSGEFGINKSESNLDVLMKSLQKVEDKIPTFLVKKGGGLDTGEEGEDEHLLSFAYNDEEYNEFDSLHHETDGINFGGGRTSKFLNNLLCPIEIGLTSKISEESMQAVSMEYLAKLETTPWEYKQFLNFSLQDVRIDDTIKLREAIGERRFRTWKLARSKKSNSEDDLGFFSQSTRVAAKQNSAVDLTALVTSAKNDSTDSSSLPSGTNQSRLSSLTPAQQRIAAAKSRDIIRRCLDKANTDHYFSPDQINPFIDNGRDLMAEAEKALRNPSAQLFLISILAQRSRLENKRTRTARQHSAAANPASRLGHIAFDCLVRLSCAMLDSCMEYNEYEMAYHLLTNSAGFIMVQEVDYGEDDKEEFGQFGHHQSLLVITMTSRIGIHPIFADIAVWEAVMALHLRDREADKKSSQEAAKKSSREMDEKPGVFSEYANLYVTENDYEAEGTYEVEEEVYEAAVATLYEMVGYGIPGEELSRFAMRVSQEHGWFCDDRGRQLLMLARRISIRRDQADIGGTGNTADIDLVRKAPDVYQTFSMDEEGGQRREKTGFVWEEIGWCHPAAPSRRSLMRLEGNNTTLGMSSVDNFMKRAPVTAIASLGSSIVASGGLDGGVFLAHLKNATHTEESGSSRDVSLKVRGIHLDWGSASRARSGCISDGEYGVGAVSCLVATYGETSHLLSNSKDVKDAMSGGDITDSMEGSRIIAGTTAGDLRVWSVKDIYSSILSNKTDDDLSGGHGASRLKFALRGKALSGHRGGVTCIDVPSQVYRPDSLVTGGADGSIKLWALRASSASRRTSTIASSKVDRGGGGGQQQSALNTLSGHEGRVLSIKTAWHGDHLLSGGADRCIRVWDLATSGGKCIHKLFGHFGWVTNLQYWGPNTIVSASTDRSVALWDARVRGSPLFVLRNHQSPISDLLVGSRTDPYMVSAAADGTIATWDFRSLSDTTATEETPHTKGKGSKGCKIVRMPSASIYHGTNTENVAAGSVHLARDVADPMSSFMSVGSDAILRKWDVASGNMLEESPTGHCDAISNFHSFSQSHGFGLKPANANDATAKNSGNAMDEGFLTSSLDGTIRMRKLIDRNGD